MVSIGEMLSFSKSLSWGQEKRARLEEIIAKGIVPVGIDDKRVLDAYKKALAKS